jgi:hypothetical protein
MMGWMLASAALVVAACGGKNEEAASSADGACGFRNAAVKPFEGFPPGVAMCLPNLARAACSTEGLRSALKKLPTTAHRFVAGQSCEAIGMARCPQPLNGVDHYEPCDAAASGKGAVTNFELPPSEPGPAYIQTGKRIAVMLPDGTVQTVTGVTGYAHDLAVGADGKAYASTATSGDYSSSVALWRLDGGAATKLGTIKNASLTTALTADKAGVVYAAQNKDVFKFDGKLTTLASPGELVTDLAIDVDNQLVAATMGGKAFVLVGDTWQPIALPEVESFDQVWAVGHGEHLVVGGRYKELYTVRGGKPEQVFKEHKLGSTRPYRSTSGLLAYSFVDKGHEQTRILTPSGAMTVSERSAPGIANTVLDGQARLWWLNDGALIVAKATSTGTADVTEYPIGSLAALTGAHRNDTHDLIVLGSGPSTLPVPGTAQIVDQVTATIYIGKQALANAEVEICTFTAISYTTSPCGDSKARKAATTNDKGEVVFEEVPVGQYSLAFKYGERWGLASGTFINIDKPGPLQQLGKLVYGSPR